MAQTTLSKPSWSQQLYAAFDMFEMDDKQGCISILQAILSEPSVPRYWRIQALVALATAVDDWYDAEEAEILYRSTRILFPRGCDTDMDTLLARNRILLDHLALELDDTMPDVIRALREQEEGEEQETDGEEPDTTGDDEDDDEDDDDSEDDGPDDGRDADSGHDEEDEAGP
ncbi:hypothetical protein E4T52_08609 [Aureobasidium sp. EXF-3400]|nr:hypothetical protein E4T51_07811 [Aureobasidium sp. EXF-12344]KAI4776447.1 hypothetical protein E4T52_08609 [Aureobasidium sp. EXF-3400]